jgi:hypothetical protein
MSFQLDLARRSKYPRLIAPAPTEPVKPPDHRLDRPTTAAHLAAAETADCSAR